MNEQNFVSRQISVYKTDKKLVELNDKLNLAPTLLYAHIHAQGDDTIIETGEVKRIYSNIGIVVHDYSAGTGAGTKRATANITPEEAQYIFSRVEKGIETFELHTDKIFGQPDKDGYAMVTKLTIKRASVGSDGKTRRFPWYIEVENGKGKPQKTKIGGTYCAQGTYVSEVKVFVNLNDLDFYKLFCAANRYIRAWELSSAPGNIRKGRQMIEEAMQST